MACILQPRSPVLVREQEASLYYLTNTVDGVRGDEFPYLAALRKTLHTLMSHYFRSEEGGERSVCLAFGFLCLLVAMLVLVVREDYLEFGLESGFSSLFDNLEVFARQQGYAEWS